MFQFAALLTRLSKLNIYKAKHGLAPHKPLLLLVILELAEEREIPGVLPLTPDLSYRFDTFWRVVAYRRTQLPDVRLPFHHIGGDGLWTPFMATGETSPDKKLTTCVSISDEFRNALRSPEFRRSASNVLIETYFNPPERNSLYHLLEIPIPESDRDAVNAIYEFPDDAENAGREGRFRIDIVTAYEFTCALTGYRVTTIAGGAIVDAAHIHQFSESKNNDPSNGIALCKNVHWLFDVGLWSLDDGFNVIVAEKHFSESSPEQTPLASFHGQRIRLPSDERFWPALKHIRWHRKHRFLGS